MKTKIKDLILKQREELVNRADAEIMGWVYEIVKINFNKTFIQDSTELREILEEVIDDLTLEILEAMVKRLEERKRNNNYERANDYDEDVVYDQALTDTKLELVDIIKELKNT